MFSNVVKNTLAQILGRGGVVLTTIITTALLTRLLGTSGYGNYVFIVALIMFFVALADWGTGLIFVREAAKEKENQESFFGNALLFRLSLATISFFLIILLIILLPPLKFLATPIKIASMAVFLISLKTSFHIVFQTKLKFEYMALTDMFIGLLFLVFLILKFSSNLSLVMFFWVLANFFGTILALFFSRSLTRFNLALNKKVLRKIVFEAMPTGALLLVFSIYNRVDVFILQVLKGSEPVGIYGLAYKVHDNLILGAAYLASALFPIISSYADERGLRGKLTLIYKKIFDVLFLAGIAVVFFTFVFAPLIIAIIGGSQFFQSVIALRILVFATFVSYFNHLTGYTLVALGKQRVSLSIAVLALAWNVTLNLIFIPRFSFIAAAGVTIATEGLVLILTSVYLARKFNLKPSFSFPKTLVEIIRTKGKIF